MEDKPKTNPNGANQFQLDPRQKLCWESYINPKSETFGNALQSALKAGYEETYSTQITATEWFIEKVRRLNMLGKAEKILDKTLEEGYDEQEILIDGLPSGKVKREPSLSKIQQDTAKFIAERLGKSEGYNTKTETDMTINGGPNPVLVKFIDGK
jgi:hypothetical protein